MFSSAWFLTKVEVRASCRAATWADRPMAASSSTVVVILLLVKTQKVHDDGDQSMVDRVNTQPQFLQGCGPQQRFSRILPKNAGGAFSFAVTMFY